MIIECSNCREDSQISNTECFNEVLIFNSLKYRGGHSSVNKNEDFILEFSVDEESGKRLFYGLKKMEDIFSQMRTLLKKLN